MNRYIILGIVISVCVPLLYWIIGKWVDHECECDDILEEYDE